MNILRHPATILEVMPDWHATGLWLVVNEPDRRLREVDALELGLPASLAAALADWIATYMHLDSLDAEQAAWYAFAQAGRTLALNVREQLPQPYDVLYFDEHAWRFDANRTHVTKLTDKPDSLQD